MREPQLLLASNSPRRRQLLNLAGYSFVPFPVDIDETPFPGELPADYVLRLAHSKAATAALRHANASTLSLAKGAGLPILAADTTVADGDAILGKPSGPEEAVSMLRRLRGREHRVFTALALVPPGGEPLTAVCTTGVFMRPYGEDEIAAYVSGGDPLDKAGAYAIQHPGFHPVERLDGCYANVVGLPLCLLEQLLRQAGFAPILGLLPCPPDAAACSFCRSLAGDNHAS